MSVIDDTVM